MFVLLSLLDGNDIDTFLDIYARKSWIQIIIFIRANEGTIGIVAVKKSAQDYLVKGQIDGRWSIELIIISKS